MGVQAVPLLELVPKRLAAEPRPGRPGGGAFAGLDPAVVASAREAGVTEGQLREVANLVRKETKLTDLPPRVHGKKNVLSESEDEEEPELLEAVEGGEQETTPAMEKAVLQLTKIVGSLTKKKSSGLEALLDNLEGGDSGGSSSSYQKLRKSLVETPKFLYETIESLMDEDFAHVRAGPGLASVETSSRAWLEHRSKLQNYTNTVRLAWQIASIHDCLRRDARDEARARSALLLTALDQAAIDNGNWTLAQEVLLEPAAPYAAFAAKRPPEVWEQSTSRILDDRWVDILMWKIKDRDAYLEARKRLAGSKAAALPPKSDPALTDPKVAAPKRQPKGGKEGKGPVTAVPEDERFPVQNALRTEEPPRVLKKEVQRTQNGAEDENVTEAGRVEGQRLQSSPERAVSSSRARAFGDRGRSSVSSFEAAENPEGGGPFSAQIKPKWMQQLLQFDRSQFLFSKDFASLEDALERGGGILDLFSGSRGIARACTESFSCWVLTFDIKRGASQDLSCLTLQERLLSLVRRRVFRAMVAGPVCASFSTAVTPPCRTFDYPAGVPWCSLKQQAKNAVGNEQLRFIQRLVRLCLQHGVRFAVENPNGSWMWKQVGDLSWDDIMGHPSVDDLKVDYCMFGCPWQKRTRFRTSLHLGGQKLFCTCGLPHVRLRGRCREKGVNYTQLAEPYPRPLCRAIAAAIGIDCKFFLGQKKKLDISACARGTHARIGEAKNPGPRRKAPRTGDLSEVELLEPATVAMRSKVWQTFTTWVEEQTGSGVFPWILGQPATLVDLLISFGHFAFKDGMPLLYFRHLLVHVQKECIAVRSFMPLAWQLVFKWEQMEPTSHRPPLPEPLLLAMAALGLAWRWRLWSSCLIFSFYAGCRVGEVLAAKREHLLLPSDLMSTGPGPTRLLT